MNIRTRSSGYQSMSVKIVAMVAIFSIFTALVVVTVYRLDETITPKDEYVWFKIVPTLAEDTTGTAFIYDNNDTLIEQVVLLNTTEWQSSEGVFPVRMYLRINIEFWHMDNVFSNVLYMIGRSPITISDTDIEITIVSDWEVPLL